MTRPSFPRRLLAALGDSTPAFRHTPRSAAIGRSRRLLSSVADSTEAFSVSHTGDEVTFSGTGFVGALEGFADTFSELPPSVRVMARTWIPRHELYELQMAAMLAMLARDLVQKFSDSSARILIRYLESVEMTVLSNYDTRAVVERSRRMVDAHDRYETDLSTDIAIDVAIDLAGKPASALSQLERRLKVDAQNPTASPLVSELRKAVMDDFGQLWNHFNRRHSRRTLNLSLMHAVSKLTESTTNLAGADLSSADLRGVPLEGVRWSSQTRWPERWMDDIRRDSTKVGPDLYEIHPGGIGIELSDVLIQ